MSDYKPDPMFNDPPEEMPLKESFKYLLITMVSITLVICLAAMIKDSL